MELQRKKRTDPLMKMKMRKMVFLLLCMARMIRLVVAVAVAAVT